MLERELEEAFHLRLVCGQRHPGGDEIAKLAGIGLDLFDLVVSGIEAEQGVLSFATYTFGRSG